MTTPNDPIQVLHVDDEPDFADMAATFLEREDDRFDVETATTASEGVDRLASNGFDCVVSDYDMPGQNGIEFLKAVRAEYGDLPFILYTGNGSEEIASEAVSAGVTDYLQKSTGTDQYIVLANRIVNVVESYRSQQALAERNRELRRYERMINSMQEAACIYDEEGCFEVVNEYLAEWYGTTRESLEGEKSNLIPHIKESAIEGDPYRELLTGHREEISGEMTAEFVGHGTATIEYQLTPLEVDGDIRGAVGVARDISEQKQREQQLKQHKTILETIDDSTFVVDDDRTVVYANTTSLEVVNTTGDEVLGSQIRPLVEQFIAEDESADQFMNTLETAFGSTQTENQRVDLTLEVDNQELIYEYQFSPIVEDGLVTAVAVTSRDVTDQRRRKRELQRYKRIVENVPVGVFRSTLDGQLLSINENVVSMFGAESKEQLKEYQVPELYHDQSERAELLDRLKQSDDNIVEDWRAPVERLTGEVMWLNVTLRLVEEEEKRYLDGAVKDITEKRQRERRLKRAETLFENAQDLLFIIDCQEDTFRVDHVNQAFEETTGLSMDDLRDKTPQQVFGEQRGTAIEENYRQCIERKDSMRYVETLDVDQLPPEKRPADVDRTYWETQIAPVELDGTIEYIVGATRNITQQKQRERDLETLHSQYKTLIENFPEGGVFLFNDKLEYVRAGGQGLSAVGLTPDDVIGQTPYDLFPESLAEELAENYQDALNGKANTFEQQFNDEYYRIQTLPISDEDTHSFGMAVSQNVTEQKEQQRDLRRQNERLEEFASFVSHDLRNPLRVAEGRLELAQKDCDSEHLDGIEEAHDRMHSLIENLLRVAREGNVITDTEPLDIATVAEDAWATVETANGSLEVTTKRQVEANQNRLRQLFENLMRNAVDHGGADVTLTIGDLEDGFYIEDDGPGIPAEERDRVFEMGYSTADDGTGFGLRIVKQIVEAHDWNIEVTDSSQGGARFEITDVEVAE